MLLKGKKIVVTGVLTKHSVAYGVADRLMAEGADVVLTSPPQVLRRTQRAASTLASGCDVLPLDITEPSQARNLTGTLRERWGYVDGVLHAMAFAPRSCLGGSFVDVPWEDVSVTLQVSTYSLCTLAGIASELAGDDGASVVALDFDARQAWPAYNWMGVAKAALEATARYLAWSLGEQRVRVNLVAAGPIRSLAARAIPGFAVMPKFWQLRAPLGWDADDRSPVAQACAALFSDLFPATTGEVIHVDGGAHAMAAGNEIALAFAE